MSPQWIPQNIQKRLLLYVLQQLSLFSEIDLPNLEEVSLNTIVLRDISLDPEKVGKIPGCNLRNGQVGYLEVSTGSSGGLIGGGVNIDASDVDIVISPDFDTSEDISSSVSFSLAQSTANLANTLILPDAKPDTPDDTDEEDHPKSASSNTKASALSGVMAKAVEMALSRLQIKVSRIKIKMISELTEVVLEIDEIALSTLNGIRNVKVSGVRLITLKPEVSPGEVDDLKGTSAASPPESPDESSANSSFDEDDDDYGNESLMDSMVFTHEEASSIYLSATSQSFPKPTEPKKEPPIVFHIDNIDIVFEGLSRVSNLKVEIGDFKVASVPSAPTIISIFNGISRSFKLKRHQKRTQLGRREGPKRNPKFPQYNENDDIPNEDDIEENGYEQSFSTDGSNPFFNKLHIKNFIVSVTSGLTAQGAFASKNTLNFVLHNVNVKQKNEKLVYGGVETFKVVRVADGITTDIFSFDQADMSTSDDLLNRSQTSLSPDNSVKSGSAKADIRFEIFSAETVEATTLISKSASLQLDISSIMILFNFCKSSSTMYANYVSMKAAIDSLSQLTNTPKEKEPKRNLQFVLQTASLLISTRLFDRSKLNIMISPISFNLQQGQLNCPNVVFSHSEEVETTLGKIANFQLVTKPQEFKSYRNNSGPRNSSNSVPTLVLMRSNFNVVLSRISIAAELQALSKLAKQLAVLSSSFAQQSSSQANSLENSVVLSKKSDRNSRDWLTQSSLLSHGGRRTRGHGAINTMQSFMNINRSNLASFRLLVKEFDINITNVSPEFGGMRLESRELSVHEINTSIYGWVKSLKIDRIAANEKEQFLYEYHEKTHHEIQYPLILIQGKLGEKSTTIDVILNNFLLEYYTNWLSLLNSNEQKRTFSPAESPPTNGSVKDQNSKRLDIRFTLNNCVIGLNPGRLRCKSFVLIDKGNSDLTFGPESFYIKSSFRDLTLVLIDDVRNVIKPSPNKSDITTYTTPLAYYCSIGYILIGKINSTHVGITFNTKIDEMIKRNEKLQVHDNLAKVDIQINSDEHQLELCADSNETILQLISDLKLPLAFTDAERSKVTVDNEMNILEQITEQFQPNEKGFPVSTFDARDDNEVGLPIINTYYDEVSKNELSSSSINLEQNLQNLNLGSSQDSNLFIDEDHFVGVSKEVQVEDKEQEHSGEKSTKESAVKSRVKVDPVRLNVNLSKIQIYLYDGYDWKSTRKSIKAAVKRVEFQAQEELAKRKNKKSKDQTETPKVKNPKPRKHQNIAFGTIAESEEEKLDYDTIYDQDKAKDESSQDNSEESGESDEDLGETLFKSIHLTLPRGTSPSQLTETINKNVSNDNKETEREADSDKTQLNIDLGKNYKNLKIRRSSYHKVMLDVKNLEVNVTVFSTRDPRKDLTDPSMDFELLNNVDLRIEDVVIYDNVPTSTWNKFLSYMNSLGKRGIGTSIIKLSLTNVRPYPKLVSAEAIVKISVLPIRLHIDQDTLDFLTRFLGFKDARFELPIDEIIYLQKIQINPIKLKLDYKPKKIDYVGIRSGKSSEFMNFFILDGSDITLEKVNLYGIHGLKKLGVSLGKAWGPSIQETQLAGILAGLSPIRSIVNIGGGVKDLIAIPMKEYKKDGRLIRSLQKGTLAFAKTTGYEIINLGAKLASGTQVILEQGEEFFGGEGSSSRSPRSSKSERKGPNKNSSDSSVKASTNVKRNNDLFASSKHLHQSIQMDKDQYGSRKLYSYAEIDDDDDESSAIDQELLSKSIFLLDTSIETKGNGKKGKRAGRETKYEDFGDEEGDEFNGDFEDFDDSQEKLVSLYSNQPESIKQGMRSAYKSIGHNLNSTKKTLINLKKEVNEAETFQESMVSVLKSSPIILIRPMIGTTEALSKALMGLSNEIDSKKIIESKDKYRYDRERSNSHGDRRRSFGSNASDEEEETQSKLKPAKDYLQDDEEEY